MANTSKLSKEERKRLQAILDQSYGSAFVNGSLAGGLGTGALASVFPTVYSLYDSNPYKTEQDIAETNLLNRQNIVGLGTTGFLLGAPIGGVINSARLMLQKRKARKLLGKTAAWQDYAIGGGVGAGMGAGAGMAMNWALGRKLLDKRLILGGALAGGGIGTATGALKSKEREGYEASQRTLRDCVQKDNTHKPIKKKLVSGELGKDNAVFEIADDGLPLMEDGVYYLKEHDAGAKGRGDVGIFQAVRDTMGHDVVAIISSTKLNPAKYYTGSGDNLKEHQVNMFQLPNGQWCMTFELGVSRVGLDGGKIKDSHGNEQDKINTARINGYSIGKLSEYQNFIVDPEADDAFNRNGSPVASMRGAVSLLRAANGEKLEHGSFLAYKLTDEHKYNQPDMLQGAMQSLVTHAVQRGGRLTPWATGGPISTRIARAMGYRGYEPATCMEYAKWGVNGIQSEGFLPQEFSKEHFSDRGAILGAAPWENVGVGPFGQWEDTQTIMDRQKAGIEDPDLTGDYYYEPYEWNLKNSMGWLGDKINGLKNNFGVDTQTTTTE